MKKLANLKGVKALNKKQQKEINGGFCYGCCNSPNPNTGCEYLGGNYCCYNRRCVPTPNGSCLK